MRSIRQRDRSTPSERSGSALAGPGSTGTTCSQLAVPPTTASVRVAPEQLGDKIVGVRLFDIRPQSLLDILGIRDRRCRNYQRLRHRQSPKKLRAYARLRTATKLNAKLMRRGHPMNIGHGIN
jgi:hypothetical protein